MKKEKNWALLRLYIVLCLFFGGITATQVLAQSLPEIKASIKAKGQRWIAQETSISTLSEEEKKMRVGLIKQKATGKEKLLSIQAPATGTAGSIDFANFVTPVRNQGSCGSCWAFAATAALESQLLMQDNLPLADNNRAEQILLSCSGAGSCRGGYTDAASSFLESTGLPSESYFPYSGTDSACSNALTGWPDDTKSIVSWSYVTTSPASLTALKNALSTYGPLVTTMDVYSDFFNYAGGVYEYSSGTYQGGHAILIVGYTDDPTVSGGGYFKVKNSWGTGWGSGGYFLIAYSQLGNPIHFGEWTIAYSIPDLSAPPTAPTALSATPVSGGQINLSWTDNSNNEDAFIIERCTGVGCSSFTQIAMIGANAIAFNNTGLNGNTSYTYRVRSQNAIGDSGYSNSASAATPCSISISPLSKSFSAPGGSATVTVTNAGGCAWTAVSSASWITIQAKTASSFTYSVPANTGARRTGTIDISGNKHSVTQSQRKK